MRIVSNSLDRYVLTVVALRFTSSAICATVFPDLSSRRTSNFPVRQDLVRRPMGGARRVPRQRFREVGTHIAAAAEQLGNRFEQRYQPQYDAFLQSSNFFLDKWRAAAAPTLYRPGCAVGVVTCTAKEPINPLTGASLGPGTGFAIGTIVPGTGNLTNGIVQAGTNGLPKESFKWPALGVQPRIGAAYDVGGTQRMVLRGNFGLFFDRTSGNSIFNLIANPPHSTSSILRFGNLQSLATGGISLVTPPTLSVYTYESPLSTSAQRSIGTQMALPWATSLDVSYVGQHGYNQLQDVQGNPSTSTPSISARLICPRRRIPRRQPAPSPVPGHCLRHC